MTREERSELWRARLCDLSGSGETQKQWCERNGVPAHQLAYWKRRLGNTGIARTMETGMEWLPVRLTPESGAGPALSSLEVRVGVAQIQVQPGFDPALLVGVVKALAEVVERGRG